MGSLEASRPHDGGLGNGCGAQSKKRWLSMRLPFQPRESLLDGVMGQGLRKQSPENWGGELGEGYGGRR